MSQMRATAWSVTINNPTADDDEAINLARQRGWVVEGQLEKGKEGTPHYQLMVKTPQVRFSAVKKAFPRAHIEVARNVAALQEYVHKVQSREGELPEQQDRYPSLSMFWLLVYQYWTRPEKDCLDLDVLTETGEIKWYDANSERLFNHDTMPWLDQAVRNMIREGYHVEGIACNPSTRTAWKKYAREILYRAHKLEAAKTDSSDSPQTDRQTDNMPRVQTVEVPVVMENTTNAVARPCPPPPPLRRTPRPCASEPPPWLQASPSEPESSDEDREVSDLAEPGE